MPGKRILIVDDEEAGRGALRRALRVAGFEQIDTCATGAEALAALDREEAALVLLDLGLPDTSGEEVLNEIVGSRPHLPVVVVTGCNDVPTAIRCMQAGAIDYLLKPVEPEPLVAHVRRALGHGALQYECFRLRQQFLADEFEVPKAFHGIVTNDPDMLRVFAYLEAVSRGTDPVLILGETGTGKELVARAFHDVSGLSGPFVPVNVAGVDDSTFSDTLFGHEPGAYTGADRKRSGMIARAKGGTLFLDEIGDLSEASQVKLLRLLQEREYYPLGSDEPHRLQARVVAATHADPTKLRQDLYFRLSAYKVRLPPLRDRLADLPALIDHFLSLAAADLGKPTPAAPLRLPSLLARYRFPGNVRELRSIVFAAVARQRPGQPLGVEPFLEELGLPDAPPPTESGEVGRGADLVFPAALPTLRELEERAVSEALARSGGNLSAAARLLGVSRPTIRRLRDRTEADTAQA